MTYLAERVGVFEGDPRKLNKIGRIRRNRFQASDLAFAGGFVGQRALTSVFGFCRRNVTQNVTHGPRPGGRL
jgi:hypothetical protein